jgi:hypothetical protein
MASNNPFTNPNRLTVPPVSGPGDRDSIYSQQSARESYYDQPLSDNGEPGSKSELLLRSLRQNSVGNHLLKKVVFC